MAIATGKCVMSSQDEAARARAGGHTGPGSPSPSRSGLQPLVLFLCRSNTATSIMAEAICEHYAQGRVRAASAGDTPAVQVNPYALECLRAHGVATRGLRSKPWGEFFGLHRTPVRFVVSLGDVYAAQTNWDHDTCATVKALWVMPDPSTVVGTATDARLAFEETFLTLESRIRKFLALPLGQLSDQALSRELALIGEES